MTQGLTVVVVCHDMRRQALRTLFSLSRRYQRGVEGLEYEVLVIDNGSSLPLAATEVAAFGPEFRHESLQATTPSPCSALNHGVRQARFPRVMVAIDGARLFSPGLLSLAARALNLLRHPFVFTLGMHLGPKVHNELVAEGFTASDEDRLLASVSWRREGYRLFEISSVALSSRAGFLSELTESNCLALEIEDWDRLGGFDERFVSPGGGLANLDFFNRAMEPPDLEPIMLLGEATFHQQHGGVATEAPLAGHPWTQFVEEYEAIRGRPYASSWRRPRYFGPHRAECSGLYPEGWRATAELDGMAD
jgi:hypothetical protein